MRIVCPILLAAAVLSGCSEPKRYTETQGSDRPLWAAAVRDQTYQFKNEQERQRYRSLWHEQLEWERPNYHPIQEQWRESGEAWRNIGENR